MLGRLRSFLDEKARPLLADYWERGEFPDQLAQPLIDLDLMEPAELTGAPGAERTPARGIYQGFRIFELARTDASLATWYTAQAGLFRTAIRVGASAEQQAGVDAQGHRLLAQGRLLADRARVRLRHRRRAVHHRPPRRATVWILDGAKRWIGGAATRRRPGRVRPRRGRRPGQGLPRGPRGRRRDAGEDPRQDRAADDAERPHHPRRRPGAGIHAPAQRELLPGRRRDAAGHALGRRLDRHRHPGRRVRGGPALRHRTPAVRPPAGILPAGPGEAGPDARQRHASRCPWWSG